MRTLTIEIIIITPQSVKVILYVFICPKFLPHTISTTTNTGNILVQIMQIVAAININGMERVCTW